jgi:hypothetical protein
MEGEVVGDIEGRLAEAIGTKMDEVSQDIQQSNQEVVKHLENMNDSIRKSYASQNSQNMRPSQTQSTPKNQGQQSRPDQSQNLNRGGSGSQGMSSGQDDRMKRLKKKFGKMEDE